MIASRILSRLVLTTVCLLGMASQALAAPPVRIAVVPASGTGMEQEVADRISDQIGSDPNVKLGKVNPDWFVVCVIKDSTDLVGQTVRVNGTVTIKTTDGYVIDTVSTQTNKQDFNLSPGVPAPMNKALVDSAARECIQGLAQRAIGPIMDAVEIEMQTRDKIIQAQRLGDEDKYQEALQILMTIRPETPHFKGARALMDEMNMELDAMEAVKQGQSLSRQGRVSQALVVLRTVKKQSKRYPQAQSLIASLQHRGLARNKRPQQAPGGKQAGTDVNAEIKKLQKQIDELKARQGSR